MFDYKFAAFNADLHFPNFDRKGAVSYQQGRHVDDACVALGGLGEGSFTFKSHLITIKGVHARVNKGFRMFYVNIYRMFYRKLYKIACALSSCM